MPYRWWDRRGAARDMPRHLERSASRFSWFMIGIQALSCSVVMAQADEFEYANWDEVPEVIAQNPARFRAILHGGLDEMRRVLILGDSQETCPQGPGKVYIPHLNHQLWHKIGHLGESALMDCSVAGSGQPTADWLRVVTIGQGGPDQSSVAPERMPPGLKVVQSLLPSSGGAQQTGPFVCLMHDGQLTADPWVEARNYMNPDARLVPEVFVYTKPNSGGVGWKCRPTDNPLAWTSVTNSGTFNLDPSDTSTEIASGRGEILDRGDHAYHRIELHGTDPKASVEIAGVRFIDSRKHHGVSIQSFSFPGYTAGSLLNQHGKCGGMLRALDFDMAIVQYGANDALGNGPNTFWERLVAVIDFIRGEIGDPCFPVVLVGDPWRVIPPPYEDSQDMYPAVIERIANDDASVMAVNMRRIFEDRYGWGPATSDHLIDEAHLTPFAQRTVARELVRILWGESELACPLDLTGDGVVDAFDVNECLISWGRTGECGNAADFNGDGFVDASDLNLIFKKMGSCPTRPEISGPEYTSQP